MNIIIHNKKQFRDIVFFLIGSYLITELDFFLLTATSSNLLLGIVKPLLIIPLSSIITFFAMVAIKKITQNQLSNLLLFYSIAKFWFILDLSFFFVKVMGQVIKYI